MDVATMVAINNLNMVTVMAVQAANNVITIVNGERMEEDMDGSMLDQYMGKDCTVSLFNEVGAIKGKLMDADIQWVKVDTKKGTQLINRNMVRNITFDNKKSEIRKNELTFRAGVSILKHVDKTRGACVPG